MNKLKTITVLDFINGKVYQYDIDKWNIDKYSIEDFLEKQEHSINGCQWMVHEDSTIYLK